MIALGFSNVINSMVFGVFPVSAGMSRSAVNYQEMIIWTKVIIIPEWLLNQTKANAATQLSAWVTAGVILISVAFIADIFVYIPSGLFFINY